MQWLRGILVRILLNTYKSRFLTLLSNVLGPDLSRHQVSYLVDFIFPERSLRTWGLAPRPYSGFENKLLPNPCGSSADTTWLWCHPFKWDTAPADDTAPKNTEALSRALHRPSRHPPAPHPTQEGWRGQYSTKMQTYRLELDTFSTTTTKVGEITKI